MGARASKALNRMFGSGGEGEGNGQLATSSVSLNRWVLGVFGALELEVHLPCILWWQR